MLHNFQTQSFLGSITIRVSVVLVVFNSVEESLFNEIIFVCGFIFFPLHQLGAASG